MKIRHIYTNGYPDSIVEKRRLFVFGTSPEEIGKGIAGGLMEPFKIDVGDGVWDSLGNLITAVTGVVNGASELVNRGVGLTLKGIDWAEYGIDRLVEWGEDKGAPDPLPEFKYMKSNFFAITSNPALQNNTAAIFEPDPEMRAIITATQKSAFVGLEMKRFDQFMKPAMEGALAIKAKLEQVRANKNMFSDSAMEKEHKLADKRVKAYESVLKNRDLPRPLRVFFSIKLTEAKSERAMYAPLVSYAQQWAMPVIRMCHYPPDSNPPEYQPRIEFDNSPGSRNRFQLTRILEKIDGFLEYGHDRLKYLADQQEKWLYVREKGLKNYYKRYGVKNAEGGYEKGAGGLAKLPADKQLAIARLQAAEARVKGKFEKHIAALDAPGHKFKQKPNSEARTLVAAVGAGSLDSKDLFKKPKQDKVISQADLELIT